MYMEYKCISSSIQKKVEINEKQIELNLWYDEFMIAFDKIPH